MSKVKKEHTGFRNGDLFCFQCGDSHKLKLPIPAKELAELCITFTKRHAKCLKTWVEPTVDETQKLVSVKDKMKWWIDNGEHGTSSKTMYSVISGEPIMSRFDFSPPSDPDDFRRCYLLLKAVPEFKMMLFKMKPLSDVWGALVDNWDTLTGMLEKAMAGSGKSPEMYDLMKKLGC